MVGVVDADTHIASREITDPKVRLADMDRLGIEIQVIREFTG